MYFPSIRSRLPAFPLTFTLSTAFLSGVLLTLCLPSLTPYFRPYLPFLYRSWRARTDDRNTISGAGLDRGTRRSGGAIRLEDHESEDEDLETYGSKQEVKGKSRNKGQETEIGEGLESCVGNTPLFRIKSLSDATGCEILAKAEFLNGAGGSPKDRVALNLIKTVYTALLVIQFNSGNHFSSHLA